MYLTVEKGYDDDKINVIQQVKASDQYESSQIFRIEYDSSVNSERLYPLCSLYGRARVLDVQYTNTPEKKPSVGCNVQIYTKKDSANISECFRVEFFSSDKSKCRIILNSDGSLAIAPTGNNSGDNVVLNEVSSNRTVWILEPVIMPYDKELSKLNFTYPLKNAANMYQINSDYGNRPKNGQVDHHEGIDIYATTGTPVYSPYSGIVVSEVQAKDIVNSSTDNRGSYIVICIDGEYLINSEPVHLYVIFMHLRENSPYNVSVGDTVNAGDLVAFSGNTGGVPAHLHMEVLFLGKEVFDPDTFDSTNFDPKNPPYQFYSRFNNTIDPIFFYQSINFTDI